jgi:hypothetical protein
MSKVKPVPDGVHTVTPHVDHKRIPTISQGGTVEGSATT